MAEFSRNRRVVVLFVLSTAIAAFSFGAWQRFAERSAPPRMTVLNRATVLPEPIVLPEFRLVDHDGAAFGPAQIQERWSLMFFGFSNCAHICPTTLRTLSETVERLEVPPRIVFLSVDPGRDTPDMLARYVGSFDADVIGVSGDDAELRKLATVLGVMYTVVPGPGPYTVEHTRAVFVVDPQGRYVALITSVDDAGLIAADLQEIMGA